MNKMLCLTVALGACVVRPPASGGGPQNNQNQASSCPEDLGSGLGVPGQLSDGTRGYFTILAIREPDKLPAELPLNKDQQDISIPLSPALAQKLGVTPETRPIAVYDKEGAPTCVGKPGGMFIVYRNESLEYAEIQQQVDGCMPTPDAPKWPTVTIMMRSASPMNACLMQPVAAISQRFLEWSDQNPKAAPAKHSQGELLPEDIAQLIPAKACGPDCVRMWSLLGVEDPTGPSVYELTVSWTHPQPDASKICEWQGDDFYAVVYRSKPGGSPFILPNASDVSGVFQDGRGGAKLVTVPFTTIEMWDLRPSEAPRSVEKMDWARLNEEGASYHSLRAYCGP